MSCLHELWWSSSSIQKSVSLIWSFCGAVSADLKFAEREEEKKVNKKNKQETEYDVRFLTI